MYAMELAPPRPPRIEHPVSYGDFDFAWVIFGKVLVAALMAGATVTKAVMSAQDAARQREAMERVAQAQVEREKLVLQEKQLELDRLKADAKEEKAKEPDLGKTLGEIPTWGIIAAGAVTGIAIKLLVKKKTPTRAKKRR